MPPRRPTKPSSGKPTPSKSKAETKAAGHLTQLLRFDRGILKECAPDTRLIGIDEVGRGSLIGPVVAAAVSLPAKLTPAERKLLLYLNDSKKLTPEIRAQLAREIPQFCHVGIGEASKEEVDSLNVYHASLLSSHRAYQNLLASLDPGLFPDSMEERTLVLLDGKALLPNLPRERQRAIVKGDGLSACIAAASVVAKHHRDSYVQALAELFPGYGWESNMGYGTPAHQEAIARLGVTIHHRLGFKLVKETVSV